MSDILALAALHEEQDDDGDPMVQASAMQQLVNSGTVWRLEGSMGRAAMDMIEAGYIMLGPGMVSDYYGNVVPGRDDVKAGTKGSRQFVVDRRGEDWARMLDKVS